MILTLFFFILSKQNILNLAEWWRTLSRIAELYISALMNIVYPALCTSPPTNHLMGTVWWTFSFIIVYSTHCGTLAHKTLNCLFWEWFVHIVSFYKHSVISHFIDFIFTSRDALVHASNTPDQIFLGPEDLTLYTRHRAHQMSSDTFREERERRGGEWEKER